MATSINADAADVPFGTYFDTKVRRTCWIGSAALLALGGGAAFLGLMGEVPWVDAGLAAPMGLVGAAWIWSMGVRPRLEVGRHGLVVVNPLRTIEVPWAEVDSFDCHHSLSVNRSNDSSVAVAALPASGLRRIVSATPGRVDRLAMQLNAYLAHSTASGAGPARVSIETAEGRRDIRVLAALAVVGMGAAATLRHLLG